MREVNFSIPSANKASVGITAQLYDRRALDCTSTLPLINSLNHLSYLTTSSARIREILTIDGGAEKLVNILKQGRSKDMMDTWKWNLAFHCVVNIGVRGADPRGSSDSRGSESIRTRVVEADVVPVLATILDNYMKALDKVRSMQSEIDGHGESSRVRSTRKLSTRSPYGSYGSGTAGNPGLDRRRDTPPPGETTPGSRALSSAEHNNTVPQIDGGQAPAARHTPSNLVRDRAHLLPPNHYHRHHHHHVRGHGRPREAEREADVGVEAAGSTTQRVPGEPFTRPRNPLLSRNDLPLQQANVFQRSDSNTTQPDMPTTPSFPIRQRALNRPRSASAPFPAQSATQQDFSMSGDSSDGDATGPVLEVRNVIEVEEAPLEFPTDLNPDELQLMGTVDANDLPAPDVTGDMEAETFNITHRLNDGSIIDPIADPPNTAMDLSDVVAPFAEGDMPELAPQAQFMTSMAADRAAATSSAYHPAFPRDEDVILALQLLAYVSKYPALRPFFQKTHLVPKLKIDRELQAHDGFDSNLADMDDDNEYEYCQPNDYNIFPLVEKFTVRDHAPDVVYWAGVVMRNLCRKDKSRGDIRQCAYYKCGKWEEYAREFAKCRRCRQTKYCSKECQKSAWVYHRHWCEPASEGQKHGHGHTHDACPSSEAA